MLKFANLKNWLTIYHALWLVLGTWTICKDIPDMHKKSPRQMGIIGCGRAQDFGGILAPIYHAPPSLKSSESVTYFPWMLC